MKKILILSMASMVIFSCKKETTTESPTVEPTAPSIEAPAVDVTAPTTDTATAGETVKLEITGDDAMKYNLSELKVPAGSTVELTLVHIGKMSKDVMGHNWTLLTKGTNVEEFGLAAVGAKDTDYIPAGTTEVIIHTKMIGGGETDTITFQAPEAGTYDFICTFPGHFGAMRGKFIVE
ncbi:MAG: azurin [Flavobacteriaceae bacterium]|nr:azurin [Flavobacteriaceae bacterium]